VYVCSGDFLFTQAKEWGLRVYEQDWLDDQFLYVRQAQANVTVAQRWLDGLAAGAARHDLFVQLCMPMPRHVLSSVAYPAVTQARATGDFEPNTGQWRVGYTAPLLAALGLAPLKDTFWTSSEQTINSYYT